MAKRTRNDSGCRENPAGGAVNAGVNGAGDTEHDVGGATSLSAYEKCHTSFLLEWHVDSLKKKEK